MTDADLAELARQARERWEALPPDQQAKEIALAGLSFAYGNLAMTTNHKPSHSAFRKLASERMAPHGWGPAEVESWLNERSGWVP